MAANLKNVKGIIWDLDGTLYRFNELFIKACNHAAAKAACTHNPSLIYEEALATAISGETSHGFSLYRFVHEQGMRYEDLHFHFHASIDEKIIDRNEAMGNAVRSLEMPSVILTNATREWVFRIMTHLGMDDIFDEENILALEDVDFQPKASSTAGFKRALDILGLDAGDVLVIEDLPRNISSAKSLGLMTALVHHGQMPDGAQSYVDFISENTIEMIERIKATKV